MKVEIEKLPSSEAREIVDLLSEDPRVTSLVQRSRSKTDSFGVVEVSLGLALVIAGGVTVQFISETAYKIRQRFRPFMVLDVTGEEPVLHVLQGASGLRGELVIKSAGGEEVRLESAASAAEVASEVLKAISPN